MKLTAFFSFCLLLNACAVAPLQIKQNTSACQNFYTAFDRLIDQESIRDVQARQISQYPFLSVNRFLASFSGELKTVDQQHYWLTLLGELNLEARQVEWQNLSKASKNQLRQTFSFEKSFESHLLHCSITLREDLKGGEQDKIEQLANVNDNYSILKRFFGGYSIASLFVTRQINKHQTLEKQLFDRKLNDIPVGGQLVRYAITETPHRSIKSMVLDSPLKIPRVSSDQLRQLFIQYAPVIEVDEQDKNDVVGRIQLKHQGEVQFVGDEASFYLLPSYTRFNGEVLLQLNYIFWFSSRPAKSAFDIYSGKLDGLIWRVTLDHQGKPLIYDSIHSCGCYHKFYLSDNIEFKSEVALQEREPPFVAQSGIKNEPLVIRVGSVAHFVERIYPLGEAVKVRATKNKLIKTQPYLRLRSLEGKEQNHSLFSDNGLIDGSERGERWLLWPMGVSSAGAMRQWGNHAVAFVGKRHFDDADLFDKYFLLKP